MPKSANEELREILEHYKNQLVNLWKIEPKYPLYQYDFADQAITKIEEMYNWKMIYHEEALKTLQAELAEAKDKLNKCVNLQTFIDLRAKLARYEEAIKQIYQEAGKPTMAYAHEVEFVERGKIIDKIIDIARTAQEGK